MNLHQPRFFTPPRPPVPTDELGWFRFFSAVRNNALTIWPQEAYERDVLIGVVPAPQAVPAECAEGDPPRAGGECFKLRGGRAASIRILRPIVGRWAVIERRARIGSTSGEPSPRRWRRGSCRCLPRHIADARRRERITRLTAGCERAGGPARRDAISGARNRRTLDVLARGAQRMERHFGA